MSQGRVEGAARRGSGGPQAGGVRAAGRKIAIGIETAKPERLTPRSEHGRQTGGGDRDAADRHQEYKLEKTKTVACREFDSDRASLNQRLPL